MSATAGTGAMLLNGQERASTQIRPSLAAPGRRYDRSRPPSPHVSVFSEGAQAPWLLLTGGLLVRIQPEEPFFF